MDTHSYVGTIITYSGIEVDLERPQEHMINIEDIAHALAMQCRYNGHVPRFYSVAEHCHMVAKQLEDWGHRDLALTGLLHDAAEAYLGDLVRPLKRLYQMELVFLPFEARFEQIIGEKFNAYLWPMHPKVKEADKAVYGWEVANVRTGKHRPLSPDKAEIRFLYHYEWLTGLQVM